jgi:L-lysine 6-transaminase
MAEENVVMLGCGVDSIRFRPPLTVTTDDLRLAVQAIDRVLTRMEG